MATTQKFEPFVSPKKMNSAIPKIEDKWIVELVKCPNCGVIQDYKHKPTVLRKHKICTGCRSHFNIKITEIATKKDIVAAHLQNIELIPVDEKIIELLTLQNFSQLQVAAKLKLNKSTISRRVDRLVKSGVLNEIKSKPYIYTTNLPKVVKTDKKENVAEKSTPENKSVDLISAITLHDCQITFKKTLGSINPTDYKYINHKTWKGKQFAIDQQSHYVDKNGKKVFYNKVIYLEETPNCVIAFPTGIGRTKEQAIENIHEKAIQMKIFLQNKYNVELSSPDYVFEKPGKGNFKRYDMVPIEVPEADYHILEEMWSDKSHYGVMEYGTDRAYQRVANLIPQVDDLQTRLSDLEQKTDENKIAPAAAAINLDSIGDIVKKSFAEFKAELIQSNNQFKIDFSKEIAQKVSEGVISALKGVFSQPNSMNSGPNMFT